MHVGVCTLVTYEGRCECGHCGAEFRLSMTEGEALSAAQLASYSALAEVVREETRRRAMDAGFVLGPDGTHALCAACRRGLDAGEWTPDGD